MSIYIYMYSVGKAVVCLKQVLEIQGFSYIRVGRVLVQDLGSGRAWAGA